MNLVFKNYFVEAIHHRTISNLEKMRLEATVPKRPASLVIGLIQIVS